MRRTRADFWSTAAFQVWPDTKTWPLSNQLKYSTANWSDSAGVFFGFICLVLVSWKEHKCPGSPEFANSRAGQSPTAWSSTTASGRTCTCNGAILYRSGNERLERDLGLLDDSKLSLSWQCALAAKKATIPWGASGPALPVRRGKGLPSALCCVASHGAAGARFRATISGYKTVRECPKEGYKDGGRV